LVSVHLLFEVESEAESKTVESPAVDSQIFQTANPQDDSLQFLPGYELKPMLLFTHLLVIVSQSKNRIFSTSSALKFSTEHLVFFAVLICKSLKYNEKISK
jgi:hypothetical protein